MSKRAYLTIDDGPSKYTKDIVDYLHKNAIPAIMFFLGKNIELYEDEALYAINKGIIIGNHSYSHPRFSSLTLDECISEIGKGDEIIKRLYKQAGCENYNKIFRFCYGDKGGENKDRIQEYLKTEGYKKLDSSGITYPWFSERKLDTDIDVYWTFNYYELKMTNERRKWTYHDVLNHLTETGTEQEGNLLNNTSEEIILIHDKAKTHEYAKDYFFDLIDRTIEMGISFKQHNLT